MPPAPKRALVVRGGRPGRAPAPAAGMFIAFLQEHGYVVAVSSDLEVYTHAALMAGTDLVVQCRTAGVPTDEQIAGLRSAVGGGTGLAGWHGGFVGTFRGPPAYLQLIGAQAVAHPGDIHEYSLDLAPAERDHEIIRGLPARITVEDAQHWVLSDSYNKVLATTTIPVREDDAWSGPVTVPAIWTRRWGAGRVFVCTPGSHLPTLEVPAIRTIVERGLLWASR